jgi:glycosyltransferase involved in cell wall biosynthesis
MHRSKGGKSLFHRLFILFIIVILPLFIVKEYRIIKAKKDSQILPSPDFYQGIITADEYKSFVFIVLTHNSAKSIERNFLSLLEQNYPRFRVVYIDKGSTDGTPDKIRQLVREKKEQERVLLIERQKGYEVCESYYQTVHECRDEEVIVHLHGHDWLAHPEVLERLNQTYMNPDVWLTYGQYLEFPSFRRGMNSPFPKKKGYNKRVQSAPWVIAPLKTFYAKLFKKFNVEESDYPNYFLSIEDENALLLPLAKIGKTHVRFIPEVLFIHTKEFNRRGGKIKLAAMTERLTESLFSFASAKVADLIIFSDDHPYCLRECIHSVLYHVKGINRIYVIYRATPENEEEYRKIKREYKELSFFQPVGSEKFKDFVLHSLFGDEHSSSYVLLSTDGVVVRDGISLQRCVEAMQKRNAYGFYFHLGREKVGWTGRDEEIEGGIYSWVVNKGNGVWKCPNTLEMGLYRKIDLERDFQDMEFSSTSELIEAWAEKGALYRVGLFFDRSKL